MSLKIKLNRNFLLQATLVFPLILAGIFLFNKTPFFVTSPYFLMVMVILLLRVAVQKRIYLAFGNYTEVLLSLVLLSISVLNFSSLRYSLPLFFTGYLFILLLFLNVVREPEAYNNRIPGSYLVAYALISFFFLFFLGFSHMEIGDRFKGFTGSPTTYAAIMATVFLIWDGAHTQWTRRRIALFAVVLVLIYLSKTRLILLFLLAYPLLLFFIKRRNWNYSLFFITGVLILFFIYPLYGVIVEYFPELITMRYQDGRDASFGLRYQLYMSSKAEFLGGNLWEILFGKGNEFARIMVLETRGKDLLPHNDFLRLLIDWGVVGTLSFIYLLYRLSVRNRSVLFISLLYLTLFYSNMVFNLFLLTAITLVSYEGIHQKNAVGEQA